MSKLINGGPAFPLEGGRDQLESPYLVQGMSLRDYFAAKAMHQFLAGTRLPHGYDASNDLLLLGRRAYEAADAMLKARQS